MQHLDSNSHLQHWPDDALFVDVSGSDEEFVSPLNPTELAISPSPVREGRPPENTPRVPETLRILALGLEQLNHGGALERSCLR